MRTRDPELDEFLAVLGKVVHREGDSVPATGDLSPDAQQQRLREAGALDLAVETADMDDALRWLVEVVARVARQDPSAAYALAARYVGQRALLRSDLSETGSTTSVTAVLRGAGSAVTVATRFAPERVVLIVPGEDEVDTFVLSVPDDLTPTARIGLAGAGFVDVEVSARGTGGTGGTGGTEAQRDWAVLVGAAALGTAEGALAVATTYASERRQFGSRLVDFTGLRAVLGEMSLRSDQCRALLEEALADDTDRAAEHAVTASVGRTAVEVCIDAIQVHGGYGYIDEYPVAGLLRDAISLQARSLPRREAVAALVTTRSGHRDD